MRIADGRPSFSWRSSDLFSALSRAAGAAQRPGFSDESVFEAARSKRADPKAREELEERSFRELIEQLRTLIDRPIRALEGRGEDAGGGSGDAVDTGGGGGGGGVDSGGGGGGGGGAVDGGGGGGGGGGGMSGAGSAGGTSSAQVTGTGNEAVNQIAQIAAGWNYQFKLSSVGPEDGWGLGGDGAGNCVDMAEEAQSLFEQAGVEARIVDGTCDSSSTASGRIGHVWIEYKDPDSGEWKMFDPTGAALQHDPSGAFTNPLNNIPN